MDERHKDRLAFLGSLASGLAHEIKNPLSTMTITLGLLHEDFERADTARDRRALKKIQLLESEVARLEKILQDFLQFAGGHTVRPRLVDVRPWLSELLEFFQPSCEGARVRLVRHLDRGMPHVFADVDLLKQAILNLLTNAVQALPEGGTVTVRSWSTGDRVRISVADDGTGIPADVLPRIFDPYFTTREQGTGLGLPTVRRILLEHGGDVSVESRAGRGTTFTLTLPVPPSIGAQELRSLPGTGLADELAPPPERRRKGGDR
jgi:signal transduction histidine kinase